MAMDPSIALQKQIRDNSSDLQKEFLDMEAWEEQMKKKDLEIRSMKDDQVHFLEFKLFHCPCCPWYCYLFF